MLLKDLEIIFKLTYYQHDSYWNKEWFDSVVHKFTFFYNQPVQLYVLRENMSEYNFKMCFYVTLNVGKSEKKNAFFYYIKII